MKNVITITMFPFLLLMILLMVASVPSSAQVPTQGLVAYYPFNGNANDESGSGNNGTVAGATLTNDRCGNNNRAYFFDGSNDEISIAHNSSFDLTGTNSLSISCWMRIMTWTYGAGIWCKAAKGGVSNYCLTLDPYNKLILIVNHYHQHIDQEEAFTSSTFALNTWYNVVVVFHDKTATLYVNGSLDMTHTYSYNFVPNNGGLYIGNDTDGDSEFFNGMIDDIRIYNRALTEVEIGALYREGCAASVALDIKPGSCPNPVNLKSKGVLPVAILGTTTFDVRNVNAASLKLAGVSPLRSSIEDVSRPVANRRSDCDCTTKGPDGFGDLTLKFDMQEVVTAIGQVSDGEVKVLTLTGNLMDGTPIEGKDCIVIRANGLGKEGAPDNEGDFPKSYALMQNQPNPFNPSTVIRYVIPQECDVVLKVYDGLGRELKTLVEKHQVGGEYEVNVDASGLASGVYFYRLQAGNFAEVRKMVLMR